ncbi:Retrovirus-related Pol polyprotein from transposon TNT 1-94-like protein [Drosera capensis]
MKDPNSSKWIKAIREEYKSMQDNKMDVKTAFLNGDIEETIYMVQPESFEVDDPKKMVCKLRKSIYGLKQASRQWYHKFHQVILSYGFEMNVVDDCVYHKFSGSKFIFLVLYVDDILLATNDMCILHETKKFLSSNFEMKDLGEASFVLGIQIHRERSRGILGLSQNSYIDKVLDRFGMQNSKPGNTPVAKGDKFSLNQCPKGNLEIQEMQEVPYASAVGSLMYAQVCTRPDIAYIVGVLGTYLSNPGMDHWKAAKRVMRYLKRTKDHMLTYRRSNHLEIVGYSDSDFAGCQDSRKSTSGYVFMLAGGAISWRRAKQTLVTTSTMEAEFVACFEASKQAIWLRNFVTKLRIIPGVERPIKILCDNKSAVLYSNNNRSSYKSKSIDIKYVAVKERV